MVKCLRCNRKLTNKESIKIGYGKKCFKIMELSKKDYSIKDTIEFMKFEINQLKKQVNNLKIHGIKQKDTIERLKQEKKVITNKQQVKMISCVSELKDIFTKTNGNIKLILKPINTNFYI